MRKPFFATYIMLMLAMSICAIPVMAASTPSWWADAEKEAEHNGYRLVDEQNLLQTLKQTPDSLLLDVRADYEFEQGHIPGALNMEFDLGDQQRLINEKKDRFIKIAGPDRSRTIIIYCRSFR